MGLFKRGSKGNDSNPKVSIITPVYNVEKYLPQCLDSILAQKLMDIEIICVNDGSTDSSLDVLNQYAEKDPRIHVLTKENRGYGHTMNMGFDAARGEYIGIVESDDFADPSMFKDMYKFAKRHDLDLVKTNYYEYSETGDSFQEPFAHFKYKRVFDPRAEQDVLTVLPIPWAALYKRSMIKDNGIRFNETPGASFQDTSFIQQVWMCARRAALLPKGYLHYRVDNSGSSVKSSSKVFAVCDEYAFSEAFMNRDPERRAAFAEILNLLKLGTYRWNFNRIAEEHRPAFAEQMAKEYRTARNEGTLNSSYFHEDDWKKLVLLMDDYDEFMSRYLTCGM